MCVFEHKNAQNFLTKTKNHYVSIVLLILNIG